MFGGLLVWTIVLITVGVILIIGGISLPIIIPMMTGFTQGSQDIVSQGTPFFQFMVAWWPLTIPGIIMIAVVLLLLSKSRVP